MKRLVNEILHPKPPQDTDEDSFRSGGIKFLSQEVHSCSAQTLCSSEDQEITAFGTSSGDYLYSSGVYFGREECWLTIDL